MKIKLSSMEEISPKQAITILGLIPTFKERLNTIYPNFRLKKVKINFSWSDGHKDVSLFAENDIEEVMIMKNIDMYYICTQIAYEGLLADPEERRKYLEGEYIFRDFPWDDLNLDLVVEFN